MTTIQEKINFFKTNLDTFEDDMDKYKYLLDSICIIDDDEMHFGSLLTCNKEYYGFDGASNSRLNKFNWRKKLNKYKFLCRYCTNYKIIFNVSSKVFFPKPKVQSKVVKFKLKPKKRKELI